MKFSMGRLRCVDEPRRLFLRPGAVEESEDDAELSSNTPPLLPLTVVPSLARVSTHGSHLSRQDSCR